MAKPPEEIPLLDIVKEFDGVGWQASCLLGSRACSAEDPCAAHEGWAKVKAQVGEFLGETSIRDLANTPSMLE